MKLKSFGMDEIVKCVQGDERGLRVEFYRWVDFFMRPSWNNIATWIVVRLVSGIKQSFLDPSKLVTVWPAGRSSASVRKTWRAQLFIKFSFCHPEVFNTYINIQWCISQTQQNFIMLIIVLGQHVSILIESSSGPSKNTDPYLARFKLC